MLKRSVNEGFSGGEKKRYEIFQMTILQPYLSILDETDSGLDIDALKIVANGVNTLRNNERSFLIIAHYQRLLDYIKPDFVHVLMKGKIAKTGCSDLALELEKKGYKIGIANIVWIKPFEIKKEWENAIKSSKFGGIVLDDDYSQGVATNLAYEIMKKTGKKIDVMGLKNKSAGFSEETDNLPPNCYEIVKKVKEIIK